MGKKKSSTEAARKLPAELYVVMERDGDEYFPLSYSSVEEMKNNQEDGAAVGVYVLQDIKTFRVSTQLT